MRAGGTLKKAHDVQRTRRGHSGAYDPADRPDKRTHPRARTDIDSKPRSYSMTDEPDGVAGGRMDSENFVEGLP